jgi:GNAT superfamily N-acetyltransferase
MGKISYEFTFAPMNSKEDMIVYLNEAFNDEVILSEINERDAVYFIALDRQVPAGYARVRISNEVKETLGAHSLEVHRLYAMPAYLGKGVGALLMKTCLDHALSRGFDWIWLGVWEKNYKAQEFYARWGFEKFGEHDFLMGKDLQTDWLLRKGLN